jgi:hypothetical protein
MMAQCNSYPVWTKREFLVIDDVQPGADYSLPFFVRTSELDSGHLIFTDEDNNILNYCHDQLYEALDHRLLWVQRSIRDWEGPWRAAIYMYSCLSGEATSTDGPQMTMPYQAQPSDPEEVLYVADYFRGGEDERSATWQRLARSGEDTTLADSYVGVESLPESMIDSEVSGAVDDALQPSQRSVRQSRQALRLDPGIGWVSLYRSPLNKLSCVGGRMHLRAHFYDSMRGSSPRHWMGLASRYGSAAIGLGGLTDAYMFVNGVCPNGPMRSGETINWQTTGVPRTQGWHLFELEWETGLLSISVDGEVVAEAPEEGSTVTEEVIWLVANRGDVTYWSGVELLHTPKGRGVWTSGVPHVMEGERMPWQRQFESRGQWWVEGASSVMTGSVIEEDSGVVVPDIAAEVVPDEAPPPPPSAPSGGIAIECWSLPGETVSARFERVVSAYVEHLIASGVVVPENFQRAGQCGSRRDPQPCQIYRFGTRRLHLNIRESPGGRLCLVVRCGGGFFDFAEFVRRNGNVEQLRLMKCQAQATSSGRQVIAVSSVLSNRTRQMKQLPNRSGTPSNATVANSRAAGA